MVPNRLDDAAFIIDTALSDHGIRAVLSGGSAATVYAPEAYQSRDLDFVVAFFADPNAVEAAMTELGFAPKGRIWANESVYFTVDFVTWPHAVGERLITAWPTFSRELNGKSYSLRIISAEDCVCDRLASFFYYRDESALEAAVAVAKAQNVEPEGIRQWAEREGQAAKFQRFLQRFR